MGKFKDEAVYFYIDDINTFLHIYSSKYSRDQQIRGSVSLTFHSALREKN